MYLATELLQNTDKERNDNSLSSSLKKNCFPVFENLYYIRLYSSALIASLLQWPECFKIINWKVLALLILTYLSVGLPEFDLFFVTSPIFLLIASYPCPLAAPLFCSPCCMGSYNRQFTENIVIRSDSAC